jgi:hypothetical protein
VGYVREGWAGRSVLLAYDRDSAGSHIAAVAGEDLAVVEGSGKLRGHVCVTTLAILPFGPG